MNTPYLLIDNSGLSTIKSCPTFGRYKLIEKREKAGATAKGRGPGKALHAALETRYSMGAWCPSDSEQSLILEALAKAYGAEPEQPNGDEYLTLARLREVMNQYRDGCRYEMGKDGKNGVYTFAGYKDEPFEVLWVEVPFAVKLGEIEIGGSMWGGGHGEGAPVWVPDRVSVIYIGRSDLGIRTDRGELIVADHKSMRRFDNNTICHWNMAAGPKGYADCIPRWIREGIDHLPEPVRMAMAPFEDDRKRLAGNVNAINGFLLNAIVVRDIHDLSRAKSPPTEFRRHSVFYSQHVLQAWREDTLRWCKAWLDWTAREQWPMNDGHCTNHFGMTCPYYGVCTLPPAQRLVALGTDEFVDATWSPLTRVEGE